MTLVAALELPPGGSRAEEVSRPVAIGLAPVFEVRRDFGAETRFVFSPELVGATYFGLGGTRLFLRPALRLGLDNLAQAEMPSDARVTERGLSGLGELGLVLDGPVVPSLSVGGGVLARWVHFALSGAVAQVEDATRLEWRPQVYAQLGLGVPAFDGMLLLEPFVRAQIVSGDDRSRLRFGVDVTVGF